MRRKNLYRLICFIISISVCLTCLTACGKYDVKVVLKLPSGFIPLSTIKDNTDGILSYAFLETQIQFFDSNHVCIYQTNVRDNNFIVKYRGELYINESIYSESIERVAIQHSQTTPPTSSPSSTSDLEWGPDGIVYTNKTLGFQMTFPKDWDGYFKIFENDEGIAVNFYGKSKTGTIGEADIGIEGLRFFIITSDVDEPSLDSVQKIGTAESVDYYYAHPGLSEDLGELFDLISDPDAASSYPYTVDQTELDLAAQDWAQAKQMRSEVQGVIDSFKAI